MKNRLIVVALLLCSGVAFAQEYKAGELTIGRLNARPTAPMQPAGGGYLRLVNKGGDDRLVSASAPVADRVELHSMRMDGDVMRMREVAAIEVPAGKTVDLKPGGLHLMFIGLKAPLTVGQTFPLKLKFEKAGEITVEMAVGAPRADDGRKH